MGFAPTFKAQTPLVAGFQTRKTKMRHRRAQIVSLLFRKTKKFISHDDTNDMTPPITRTRFTAAISEKPGHRLG